MGSIEKFDFKQLKWVPYRSTPEDVEEYFRKMDARREEQEHGTGRLMKRLRDLEEKLKATEKKLEDTEDKLERKTPQVTQVTPVAQAIEIAESEVRKKGREEQQRKKTLRQPFPFQRLRQLPYHGPTGSI